MTKWLFVGPTLLSGIGQVTKNYADCVKDSEYVALGNRPKLLKYDCGFAFVIPIESQINILDQYKPFCKKWIYMTVCETRPVNPCYGILEKYKTMYVPSNFAKIILENQFPKIEWKVLHHWCPTPIPRIMNAIADAPYIFYTIGNVIDPRKNIKLLVQTFLKLNFKNSLLVLKATCHTDVTWDFPNVKIINGLLPSEDIEEIHSQSHCYVNCSHSEGVGMGAVEAAMHNKPVIITDFGGLQEYVKTPWVVPCTEGPIGFDDFLFTKDLHWGFPSEKVLEQHMTDCYEKRVTVWDHSHTRELISKVPKMLCS